MGKCHGRLLCSGTNPMADIVANVALAAADAQGLAKIKDPTKPSAAKQTMWTRYTCIRYEGAFSKPVVASTWLAVSCFSASTITHIILACESSLSRIVVRIFSVSNILVYGQVASYSYYSTKCRSGELKITLCISLHTVFGLAEDRSPILHRTWWFSFHCVVARATITARDDRMIGDVRHIDTERMFFSTIPTHLIFLWYPKR